MAQTMPDALFGPVLIVAILPVTHFIDYNLASKTLVRKHKRNFKKELTNWPKRCKTCLGSFSLLW